MNPLGIEASRIRLKVLQAAASKGVMLIGSAEALDLENLLGELHRLHIAVSKQAKQLRRRKKK
jgi:hypothetical protein